LYLFLLVVVLLLLLLLLPSFFCRVTALPRHHL